MIEKFVKRPAMTIVFVLVFVVLGLFSYFNLIIEATPKIDLPIVSIAAPYPGAGPVEIESEIIKRIEDAVAEVSEIDKITANAYEGFGLIMIEFDISADVNLKAVEIKDKVEQILNDLPEDAERPIVSKFDPLVVPIQVLVITSDTMDSRDLYEYADNQLKPLLSTVPGVASVELSGGKQRQINVNLDPNLMKEHFVTLSDVTQAIEKRNLSVPGGSFTKGAEEITVRFQGEFQSVDEIRRMPIVTGEGLTIQLSDVATIEDSFKKVETISRFNGKDSVGLSINKLSDGDAVSISAAVKKATASISQRLPEGVSLHMAYDSTERILRDTESTLINIVIGILLTVFILLVFLGNFRVTLVAAVVIPTSIVSTFLLMDFSKFTINMMSLLAIGTALGTLIANAIVIIEAVVAEMEKGSDSQTAAIEGTKKVALAVWASAGTNLVVFTPIGFMGGIVGQFMKQFGLTVVYATLFSILASFTLTPMLCAVLLRNKKPQQSSENGSVEKTGRPSFLQRFLVEPVNRAIRFMLREYRVIFNLMFRFPKSTLLFSFLLFLSPALIMPYIGKEFFTMSDEDVIRFTIEMPQGSSLNETLNITERLESIVQDLPEVDRVFSRIGEDGPENSMMIVRLVPKEERERSDLDIIRDITPQVAKVPDADVTMSRGGGGGGGGQFGDITIDVYGYDYDQMVVLSEKFQEVMKNTGYFRSVVSSHKQPKDEIVFYPDDQLVQRYGVNNSDIGGLIRTAVTGNDSAVYREKGEEYPINVTLSDRFKTSVEDIKDLFVNTREGLLPLDALGEVTTQKALPPLQRREKQRIIQINGYLSKSTAGVVQGLLTEEFDKLEIPEGYTYRFSGQAENMAETSIEMGKAFLMAVILTYMLLVAVLNSFAHPFTISSTVFTSFVGVFFLLFFLELSINIGSMMAFVMLVGLVVNNAILLLDKAMVELQSGRGIIESLWTATEDRFRPIAMTTISVIVGALPQVFDSAGGKASMGAVIVGGMIGSLVFTFLLVPVVFWYVERAKGFFGRKLGSQRGQTQPPKRDLGENQERAAAVSV